MRFCYTARVILTYADLIFLRTCGISSWDLAGSMMFQRFLFENGTRDECEHLHALGVGFSAFMKARRSDEIERLLMRLETQMGEGARGRER